jgi:hypothetical protein
MGNQASTIGDNLLEYSQDGNLKELEATITAAVESLGQADSGVTKGKAESLNLGSFSQCWKSEIGGGITQLSPLLFAPWAGPC